MGTTIRGESKMKKILLITLLIVLLGGGTYGWGEEVKSMDVINPYVEFESYQLIDNTAYLSLNIINGFYAGRMWKESHLLKKHQINNIIIYINSGGGSGSAAASMIDTINKIKKEGIKITTVGHGMVASAAIPIFLAGDERISTKNTVFLIHPGTIQQYGFVSDTIATLKSKESAMNMMRTIYARFVADNSTLSLEDVIEMMEKDNWFTADQAKKWGMIDKIE